MVMVTHKEIKGQNRKTVRSAKNSLQRDGGSDHRKTGILPGADLFRQRSLGNSYLQSAFTNQMVLPKQAPNHSAPVIQRKCSCGGTCASCAAREQERRRIQSKLKVGASDDAYEREADRVAEQVMRMPEQTANNQSQPGIQIQRIPAGENAGFDAEIHLNQSDGQPLSAATRRYMEPRFGMDFSPVRLHTGPQAQQSAEQIQARAFTYGNHIWLGAGASESDRGLMAHELAHVVQQHNAKAHEASQPLQRQPESGTAEPNIAPGTLSASLGSSSLRRVKVWINSFIPMPQVTAPTGQCFAGDNRGFSNFIHASARTHQEIEFDAMTLVKTIDWKRMGTTHEVNCTSGTMIRSATAPIGGLINVSVSSSTP